MMSHLISIYNVCGPVFETSIYYSLDETFIAILQTQILSSAFRSLKSKSHFRNCQLTLKAPVTTAADDIHKI